MPGAGRGTRVAKGPDEPRGHPDAPITTRTGHCHWLGLIAEGHQEAGQAAERMLAEDADFLKVMATGGNMTPSSDPMKAQYDDETLRMIADIGRAAGKHTAAHVLSRSEIPQCTVMPESRSAALTLCICELKRGAL